MNASYMAAVSQTLKSLENNLIFRECVTPGAVDNLIVFIPYKSIYSVKAHANFK